MAALIRKMRFFTGHVAFAGHLLHLLYDACKKDLRLEITLYHDNTDLSGFQPELGRRNEYGFLFNLLCSKIKLLMVLCEKGGQVCLTSKKRKRGSSISMRM
ncbi:hypothetical protein CULT_460014 [[Clostridium] ultunense Esp]|nr:hypothetical protein CULT_460014 [[Clostridium] ultunense Esp]